MNATNNLNILFLATASANATPAVPPRSVIETHGMSTQGQRLPSAMELSLLKIQRERQMAQALIEQRQLSAQHPNSQPMLLVSTQTNTSLHYLTFSY